MPKAISVTTKNTKLYSAFMKYIQIISCITETKQNTYITPAGVIYRFAHVI